MLAFNWFFLPPVHTFTLADSENWFALAVYLATAVVVSELAARARRRAAAAEQRERESALLAELATDLLSGRDLEDEIGEIGAARPRCSGSPSAEIELGEPHRPPARCSPFPLAVDGRTVGTLYTPEGSDPNVGRPAPLPAGARRAARRRRRPREARARGARGRGAAAQRPRQDRAAPRGLARPPLAAHGDHARRSARCATQTLQLERRRPRRAARDDRRSTRERLGRLVARPARPVAARGRRSGARAASCGRSTTSSREAVDSLGARERVDVVGEAPLVDVDGVQIQRVLANLIENALKFSPPGAHVVVRITATRKEAIVRVVDQGPGVAGGRARARLRAVLSPRGDRRARARASASRSRAASRRRTAAGSGRSRGRARARRSRSRCPVVEVPAELQA